MPSSTSPNMVLFLPVPSVTAGPAWASETTSNWSTLDTHDHTAGKGVQIPIAALNVNADFSWLTFGQTNVGYLSLVDKLATGNLTVNQSFGNVAGDPYWRNASGVVKKLSLAGDPLTIPSGTSALGSLLMTGIAAPGSPAAGFGSLYFDSTATNIAVKNSAGVVKHGVQTKAAVSHQFLTSIADDGSSVLAQPAYSDISGNSGSSAGRPRVEVLIDDATMASQTSYTSPSWAANLYRSLRFEIRVTVGSPNVTMTLTGLSGNYKSMNFSHNGTTLFAAQQTSWLASVLSLAFWNGEISCATGTIRTLTSICYQAAAYMTVLPGTHDDTTNGVTGLSLAMTASSTFKVTLWGVPS